MAAPTFYTLDYDTIRSNLYARYEAILGVALNPAQPESLVLDAVAYELLLHRQQMQNAALQMLVSFATAPALDYLAELLGVYRLPASAAVTTLTFTLTPGHVGVTILSGTRVSSLDGLSTYLTDETVSAPVGTNTLTVTATAEVAGVGANDYGVGQVSQITSPLPFVNSVTNTTVTSGGAVQESDEAFRARIKSASSVFSVAGPRQAYEFFARSASPAIVDVAVTTPQGGVVNVYPLVPGGPTSQTILDLVSGVLNADNIRPLTDTVNVLSPTTRNINVQIGLTVYASADAEVTRLAALARVEAYLAERQQVLGLDVTIAQLIAMAVGDAEAVQNADVVSPTQDLVLQDNEALGTFTVSVTVNAISNDG